MTPGHFPTTSRRAQLTAVCDALGVGHQQRGQLAQRRLEIRAPKYGSERVVYLPEALVNMLAAHVEDGVRPEGWLCIGVHDGPPHQNTVGYWWRKMLRDAGLKDIKLHDLRHFYVSGIIAEGCDVVTVQRALGHSTATTTLNILPGILDAAVPVTVPTW
jgi:integrase